MVDMRVPGYLTPPLRRVAFLIASRDFSCTYCTAHACAFGDMFLGSVPAQVSRGAQSAADLPDSPASRAIQALASAAVRRPLHDGQGNQDLSHLIGTASEILGPLALEITKAVIAFSGFLNTIMDVQGVPLEPHAQTFAASHMPVGTDGTPWAVGEYHGNASRAAADTFDLERLGL